MMKSAIRIEIDTLTTVRVVLSPTPSVPPDVRSPKWQPTMAMMKPKTGVLAAPLRMSVMLQDLDRAPEEEVRRDVVLNVADEDGAERAEHEGERAEDRHGDDGREGPRQDELLGRVRAESADGVHLLGDVHGPDLGGHAAADAAADDHRRQRRRELAGERQDDDPRDVLQAAEAREPVGELDGHDHADEDRRDGDDPDRAHPERLELVDGGGDLERAPEHGARRVADQQRHLTELVDEEPDPLPLLREQRRLRRRRRGLIRPALACRRRRLRQRRRIFARRGHGAPGTVWKPCTNRSNSSTPALASGAAT